MEEANKFIQDLYERVEALEKELAQFKRAQEGNVEDLYEEIEVLSATNKELWKTQALLTEENGG